MVQLQEPEVTLKRISASALSDVAKVSKAMHKYPYHRLILLLPWLLSYPLSLLYMYHPNIYNYSIHQSLLKQSLMLEQWST